MSWHLEVRTGREAFAAMAADWDRLITDAGAPATLCSGVMTAWLRNRDEQPVVVWLTHDGRPVAGAAFGSHPDLLGRRLSKIGVPGEPYGLPALDRAAAAMLARRLPGALASTGRRWRMTVTDLPDPDPVVDELARFGARRSAHSRPTTPCLDVGPGSRLDRVISRNTRSVVARARRRIAADGRSVELRWQTGRNALDMALPDLLSVHMARNRQLRGTSILADPMERAVFVDTLRAHADHDRLLLLTTRIDWGGGVQRYKLSGGAVVSSTQTLTLSSSAALGVARALHRRVRLMHH